jgi:hypothetical protein
VTAVNPTSRKGREKWGTRGWSAAGGQRIPPGSLGSRFGMASLDGTVWGEGENGAVVATAAAR